MFSLFVLVFFLSCSVLSSQGYRERKCSQPTARESLKWVITLISNRGQHGNILVSLSITVGMTDRCQNNNTHIVLCSWKPVSLPMLNPVSATLIPKGSVNIEMVCVLKGSLSYGSSLIRAGPILSLASAGLQNWTRVQDEKSKWVVNKENSVCFEMGAQQSQRCNLFVRQGVPKRGFDIIIVVVS